MVDMPLGGKSRRKATLWKKATPMVSFSRLRGLRPVRRYRARGQVRISKHYSGSPDLRLLLVPRDLLRSIPRSQGAIPGG